MLSLEGIVTIVEGMDKLVATLVSLIGPTCTHDNSLQVDIDFLGCTPCIYILWYLAQFTSKNKGLRFIVNLPPCQFSVSCY